GGERLEDLRHKWLSDYEFVLIDSRTGVTDAGGVCTIHLPDVLIVLFSANEQSFLGAMHVARTAAERHATLPFDRTRLIVLPILARFDSKEEITQAEEWMNRCSLEIADFYEQWLPEPHTARELLERLKIPYIPYFSFGEKLPVLTHSLSDPQQI